MKSITLAKTKKDRRQQKNWKEHTSKKDGSQNHNESPASRVLMRPSKKHTLRSGLADGEILTDIWHEKWRKQAPMSAINGDSRIK
jgi:hypothetical protein